MIQSDELKSSAASGLKFGAEIRGRRIWMDNRARHDHQSSRSTKLLEGPQFVIAFTVDRVC
jgi:hypothetical protein